MFRLSTTTALDSVEAGGPFLWTILSVMVFFFSVCFKPFSWPILSHNFMSMYMYSESLSLYLCTYLNWIYIILFEFHFQEQIDFLVNIHLPLGEMNVVCRIIPLDN